MESVMTIEGFSETCHRAEGLIRNEVSRLLRRIDLREQDTLNLTCNQRSPLPEPSLIRGESEGRG